jgi:MFS family permease
MLALYSFAAMPLTVLMPVFASTILKGTATTLGFLMAASGAGALIGALYLASRQSVLGLGRHIAVAGGLFGLGIMAFSLSRNFWLSLACLMVTGFCMMLQMAASNTLLQTLVDEDKRGRVMSLYTMAFLGTAPLGSFVAGIIADRYGAPLALQLAGLTCLGGALAFGARLPQLRELVRPIYQSRGILPSPLPGIQSPIGAVPPQNE